MGTRTATYCTITKSDVSNQELGNKYAYTPTDIVTYTGDLQDINVYNYKHDKHLIPFICLWHRKNYLIPNKYHMRYYTYRLIIKITLHIITLSLKFQ